LHDEARRSVERRCVAQFELLCRRNKFAVTLSERACELYSKPNPYSPRVGPWGTETHPNLPRHTQMKYACVVISAQLM